MSFDTSPAISVRGVTKKYQLYSNKSDRVKEALHPLRRSYHHDFTALSDVNLDVVRGETLGVVGRNGSGKSTLLQIISGVMHPTQGSVHVNGRIAALLELGAGFNPEFSGRENAILNGAVMGFSHEEMGARLGAIEAFAEIGEYFDQPVKTYSSGMFARLAFSCAINVDPDILIVDEALSVGDAKFQNKCYMKFKEFQSSGKTIIFVSHSTEAILRNCDRAILLDGGRLLMQAPPQSVIDHYYNILFPSFRSQPLGTGSSEGSAENLQDASSPDLLAGLLATSEGRCEHRNTYNPSEFRFGDREVEIVDYALVSGGRLYPAEIQSGADVSLFVRLKVNNFNGLLSAGIALKTVDGIKLYGTNTISSGIRLPATPAGESLRLRFDFSLNAGPGDLFIDIGCGDWSAPPARPLDRRHSLIHIVVTSNQNFDGLINCFCKTSIED